MIRSFRCAETRKLFNGGRSAKFQAIERPALRKLEMLNAAIGLSVLAAVPGNRLERLKGNRQCQHSIRINDQWRVCFVWRGADAFEVEIADYH
ncbi:MAG TPA: type II toxin-antitoxin system RelE/ParE family toxin [Candidatus Binataceae bacterium]|nr:type II toxin-antitoxin system RelE/ParE family toxin [Candidatus Binataceae bacterium]